MNQINNEIREPAALAADSYLALSPHERTDGRLREVLRHLLVSGDSETLGRLFQDGRWISDWLLHEGRYPSARQERKWKAFVDVLCSCHDGEDALEAGLVHLASRFGHGAQREKLARFARFLCRSRGGRWPLLMWRLLGDSFCLYSSLDAALVESVAQEGHLPPSGSFLLLEGGEECRRLFFRVGFPYYSKSMTDWSRFCRFVVRHPWAWEHMLTMDMNDTLLAGMMEYIHDLPPSLRDPRVAPFLERNRASLMRRLGAMSYLAGSPQDYAALAPEDLSAMSTDMLMRTGAAGYHVPSRKNGRGRSGLVVHAAGGRAVVLCSDTVETEVRQMLYDDLRPGDPVLFWRDGVMAIRRMPGDMEEDFRMLRLRASAMAGPWPERLRYPVFEYRDMAAAALDALARDGFSAAAAAGRYLGRERILDAMWRMPPARYAREALLMAAASGI